MERKDLSQAIYIVCTGNTCRSPMAKAILVKMIENSGNDVRVESFGLNTIDGLPATNNAVMAMNEIGIDIKSHSSRQLMIGDAVEIKKIIVMSNEAAELLVNNGYPKEKIIVLGVSDPYGKSIDEYRKCRDYFIEFFKANFDRLVKE